MKRISKSIIRLLVCIICGMGSVYANATDNQTDTLSPILSGSALPFQIVIEQASFRLPVGFHSGVVGVSKGKWIFIAGRINGLHGFGPDPFRPDQQNTSIYVVDFQTGAVNSRALNDPSSGLSQQQIDTLSVTSPQGHQEGDTLYMTGGYGVDNTTGRFGTKPVLTAFYLPGLIDWVIKGGAGNNSVIKNMRQLYNQQFQITGGRMYKLGNMTQLVFGQNFDGVYTDDSNGIYSQQVRQFVIKSVGGQLAADFYSSMPSLPNPNFRRRDLNVVPAMLKDNNNLLQYGLVAYAGVFTTPGGVWTVPVVINGVNDPVMADPNSPSSFKQGMNQYVCATASLYSGKHASNYHIFFGGISYGFYQNGVFTTDSEIPFINDVTTVRMDQNGNFTQYLMSNTYPKIVSTASNPGNTLLFGAGAYFIPNNIPQYPNKVINLDVIKQSTVIGYIVGGIQSTLANTNTQSDSAASPYVFKVILVPN